MKKLITLAAASILAACSNIDELVPIDSYTLVHATSSIGEEQNFLSFYSDNEKQGGINLYSRDAITMMYDNVVRKHNDEYEMTRHQLLATLVNEIDRKQLSDGLSLVVELMGAVAQGYMAPGHSREVGKDFSKVIKGTETVFSEVFKKEMDFNKLSVASSLCQLNKPAERAYRMAALYGFMPLEHVAELALSSPQLLMVLQGELEAAYKRKSTKSCFEHQIVLNQINIGSDKTKTDKTSSKKMMPKLATKKSSANEKGLVLLSEKPVMVETASDLYASYINDLETKQQQYASKTISASLPLFKSVLDASQAIEQQKALTSTQKQTLNTLDEKFQSILGNYATPYLTAKVSVLSNNTASATQYDLLNIFGSKQQVLAQENYASVFSCVRTSSPETMNSAVKNGALLCN